MIIRRQLYADHKLPVKKTHDSGMELKPIFKKVAQTTPGNKILHSTSAGNSTVRDVEDLLKPIQHQKHQQQDDSSQSLKERTERNLWRNDEVMEMLYTMQELKALEKLNDKTVKSENVFKDVEVVMHRNGFVKKSHVQIWTKWKFLKSTYMTSRRNGVIPRMVPPQVYDTIHKMITGLNQSITDSCSSVDGDNSSVSGMVISGVEGGVSDTGAANGQDEDSFGMAHPIFGFRLGMVKSEPEDTGYEAVENQGSDKDPLGEEHSPAKSDNQVKEENNHLKLTKETETLQKPLEIPHRGRGRPPKNPPAATSTPNSSPAPVTKPAQMPPLRVAPFAKAINNTNSIAVNRPPPPLTMPPTPRIRVTNLTNLKNGDPSRFAQPKLTPKPNHQQQTSTVQQQVRLPKEVTTTQSRASSTPSPSYPKMKQIPMRKTPYSLRPDRAIPDLDASLSPPPPPIEKPSTRKIEEVPSIRHLMLQSNPNILQNNNNNNNNNRKRRLEVQEPLIGKQAKYSNNTMENDIKATKSFNSNNNNNSNNNEDSKNYAKVLQNVMVDLSISLRKMQNEMMQDFFKKQNELLEKEHKFQMQQDHMLMKAFQEQTQEIMSSVKQLVGNIKINKNEAKLNVKNHMQQRQQQRTQEHEEEEMEEHVEGDDNEQEQEQEHEEHDQTMEDEYTDGEEQQDQLEEQDDEHENEEQEELENNANEEEDDDDNEQQHEDDEQSQTTDEHQENGLTAEENDDNSNDSTEDDQNPLH